MGLVPGNTVLAHAIHAPIIDGSVSVAKCLLLHARPISIKQSIINLLIIYLAIIYYLSIYLSIIHLSAYL